VKEKIGQADVDVVIFDAGGKPIEEPMTARERWTVEAINTTLLADPPFRKQYPGAALERVEVMRSMDKLGAGRHHSALGTEPERGPGAQNLQHPGPLSHPGAEDAALTQSEFPTR
jgi:hypothetical protein